MSDDVQLTIKSFERAPWMAQGECQGMPTSWFFPARGESLAEQRAVCAVCPVKTECLDYALRNGEKYGVWGGTGERERRLMRREQGIVFGNNSHNPAPLVHGTNAGYQRHRTRKEPACDACKQAHAEYRSNFRIARGQVA